MSADEFNLTPEQRELEKALSGMVPTAAGMDRDALMFAAGEAAARAEMRRPMVWPWKVAACVGMSLSVGLGVMATRERPTERGTVAKTVASSAEIVEARNEGGAAGILSNVDASWGTGSESSPWSYYTLRNEALRWGVNVLPTAPNGGAGGAVVKEERGEKGVGFNFNFRQLFNAGGRS